MSDDIRELLLSPDDNIDEVLEEFETDPAQFVELTDDLRDAFFGKMLTARPSNRSRLLTLLTEIRNDEDIIATKEQYGDLRKLKLGSVYVGVKRKAARFNMVKQMLTLLDSRDPDNPLSASTVVIPPSNPTPITTTTTTTTTTNVAAVASALTYSGCLTNSGNIELPGPQSPLPKLLPPAPSISALAAIHKKRVQFGINDLLDVENDVDDSFFYKELKEYVGSLPQEEQIRYIDLASDDVKENMICAGQYIANYARFRAGEPYRVTVLVIGEAGIGKSCLVNEIHRGHLKHKCLEGVGGTSITQDLDSKSVVYTRPVTDEENFSGIEEETIDVTVEIIDTPGLSRSDMDKPEKMTGLIDAINARLTDGFSGAKSTVHMVVWCVQGTAGRLPHVDELWVRQLGKLVPIILVWTRAFLPNHIEEFRRWMNDRTLVPIELPFSATIPIYARREETSLGGTMPSFNMPLLGRTIGSTFNIETRAKFEVYRQQLAASTEADFLRRRSWSYKVVLGAMASASLVGGSPIPYVDSIGVLAIQSAMVVEINRSYGVSLPKNVVNTMLYTIITGSSTMTLIGSTSLAGALILDFTADTLKLIPGLNFVGQLVSAGIAGGLTAALGVAFIRALEKVVRQYPNLMDVPKDRIEQLLMEEAREQAKLSLNDAAAEVRRYSTGDEENKDQQQQ